MSSFEDAVYDQAADDALVNHYIQQGQYEKARNRIWQIAQDIAKFLGNIASVVNAVNTVLHWLHIT